MVDKLPRGAGTLPLAKIVNYRSSSILAKWIVLVTLSDPGIPCRSIGSGKIP
jgi:hypothetical protein